MNLARVLRASFCIGFALLILAWAYLITQYGP
jgi:hypothetical protein